MNDTTVRLVLGVVTLVCGLIGILEAGLCLTLWPVLDRMAREDNDISFALSLPVYLVVAVAAAVFGTGGEFQVSGGSWSESEWNRHSRLD